MPIPVCDCNCYCGAIRKIIDMSDANHLMQFPMCLSEGYNAIRNNVLVMNHLPSASKAYSTLLHVEKQM